MSKKLEGKVAIITGAGRGLGKVLALRFAKEGAKLLLPDISLERAEKTAVEIRSTSQDAMAMEVDISDESSIRKMAEAVIEKYGKVDILVNNAAVIYGVLPKPWDGWTTEEWNRIFSVNVTGTWLCCKAIAPLMKNQSKGKIINIASDIFRLPAAQYLLTYSCSKAAVWSMTQALAMALGPFNINVNAIAPGRMATEASLLGEDSEREFEFVIAMQALKRRGEPEYMVDPVLFLASEESDFITGQVIVVDGGALMF